jgi:hypothetical protein
LLQLVGQFTQSVISWVTWPAGVDDNSLNIIYNLADVLNKIAFGVIIWNVAVTESEAA